MHIAKFVAGFGIIAILGISFVAYFALQSNYEQELRSTMFEQYKQTQVQYARSVSQNIGSDLDSLMDNLKTLSAYPTIQNGDFTGAKADKLLQATYNQTLQSANVDGLFLVDRNGKIVNYVSNSTHKPNLVGYDLSHFGAYREYLANGRKPTFSNAYILPEDGRLRVALLYPIYNQDTGEYLAAIRMPLVLHDFLSKYGNLDDINSQYIVVLDKNATFLSTPLKSNVGVNYFSNQNQAIIANPLDVEHFRTVLSGKEHTALFAIKNYGERLNTGEPIILDGKQQYSVFVVTPTAAIYSQIDSVIAEQRTVFYVLQAGIAAGIGIAVFFLVRWNGALERAVKKRTVDLQHANKDLEDANQKLKQQDQMQREFINIAAHELRTPIQPIIVTTELLGISPEVKEDEAEQVVEVTKGDLSIIARNAKRLERLSSDILDVIRIESSSFRLEKQEFDLGMLVKQAVEDSRRQATEGVEIRLANDQHISVFADKQRITQVLSNLLNNAIRFTKPQGTIYVAVQTIQGKDENNQVKVTVTDTGSGIDRAVLPRLFTKFSSTVKADSGTGLGLYICKSIIDAHGGLIWGENNPNNKGAAFGFIIPTKPIENQSHADVLARAVEKHESLQSDSVYSLARKAFGNVD